MRSALSHLSKGDSLRKDEHLKLQEQSKPLNMLSKFINLELTRNQTDKLRILHLDDHTLFQWGVMNAMDPDRNKIDFIQYQYPKHALTFLKIAILRKYKIDLIITDLRHPGIDGYEFAKKIREMELKYNRKEIPILLISIIEPERPIIADGLKKGYFTRYLSRNVTSEEIWEIISQ